MPTIIVDWLAIRSEDQKRQLVERITPIVAECAGMKPENVIVKFREDQPHNWAKGGVFGTDLNSDNAGKEKK